MIVWGGASRGRLFADGAAYNPATDGWRTLATAPLEGRTAQTSVWTGAEVIVWGGCCDRRGGEFGDGAAYEPGRDRWRSLPRAPIAPRTSHTAVWTGEEMVVWGGHVFEREFGDGAAYDPERNRWRILPEVSVEPRYSHSAVWASTGMIVWGGATTEPAILSDGATFSNDWTRLERAHSGRSSHTAAWSGDEMIVWGGCCDESGGELPGGAAYDPKTRRWRALPESSLGARQAHVSVWLGDRMVIWGGQRGLDQRFEDGAFYDPEMDRWSPVPASPLEGRAGHAAVWTGDELLIWGGCCAGDQGSFADGAALPIAELASEEPTTSPDDVAAEPELEPEDADFGIGAMIALGGLILLVALAASVRALRKRVAR